jgi:hypothetical protein
MNQQGLLAPPTGMLMMAPDGTVSVIPDTTKSGLRSGLDTAEPEFDPRDPRVAPTEPGGDPGICFAYHRGSEGEGSACFAYHRGNEGEPGVCFAYFRGNEGEPGVCFAYLGEPNAHSCFGKNPEC